MKGKVIRLFGRLMERLIPDNTHDVYGDGFDPCQERHPKHFLLCGNWDYARKHELYPAGHPGLHVMVGRVSHADAVGYVNLSASWLIP